VQRYKYINMVQDKIERYNELKYKDKKVLIMIENTQKILHIWILKQRHSLLVYLCNFVYPSG
jgi:hypothetical protein